MLEEPLLSLSEVHRSVKIPDGSVSLGRRLFAFGGPAYLVSVGYMDPGNWATDLEGGSRFGYQLLWVLVMSNLMAILLQTLSARLGVVTGRDLAQACRDHYSKPVSVILWVLCEIAIAACDLAEVLGTAIALNLLFGLQLIYGVLITALDVLFLLGLQRMGMRKLEMLIISLVFVIGCSFAIEMFLAKPDIHAMTLGFVPHLNSASLYVAIGILGATVMPHNLYLHSALVQTRQFESNTTGKRQANRYNFVDSLIALNSALFVNGGILILAAAVFFSRGVAVTQIQQAHELLAPLLGNNLGSILFAVALLASGQSSTITGTLAGQIVMEGFVKLKIRPAFRRLVTRALAIIPAALLIGIEGDDASYDLLIFSQVLLSMQLAFAIVPLIHFTSSKEQMGEFANGTVVKLLAWITAAVVIGLNAQLFYNTVSGAMASTGSARTLGTIGLPVGVALGIFLLYVMLEPFLSRRRTKALERTEVRMPLVGVDEAFGRIGVALDSTKHDDPVLRRALALARQGGAEARIVLIHVASSAPSSVFGKDSHDLTARTGQEYLTRTIEELAALGVPASAVLGFGSISKELVRIAREQDLDILILGAHGHRGISDLMYGATISSVRHALDIPILVVK
jgi:manganese transport protein